MAAAADKRGAAALGPPTTAPALVPPAAALAPVLVPPDAAATLARGHFALDFGGGDALHTPYTHLEQLIHTAHNDRNACSQQNTHKRCTGVKHGLPYKTWMGH